MLTKAQARPVSQSETLAYLHRSGCSTTEERYEQELGMRDAEEKEGEGETETGRKSIR